MTELDKTAKALRLFNEKADKLARLSFVEKMNDPNVGFTLSFENLKEGGSKVTQERRGPEEEAIDAFVNTFRFFIQNNEQSSFDNMEKHYLAAPVDKALKQEFFDMRNRINQYLDVEPITAPNFPFTIEYNNEKLTRRRIMDVFVYGGLSHANEEKRRLHKMWINDPFVGKFIEQIFVSTLADVFVAIAHIQGINERALQHLPGPS
jgi:hypothetical protein